MCCNCFCDKSSVATLPCIFLQALVLEDEIAAMPQPLGSRRPSETLPLAGNANKTGNTSFLGAVTTMLKFCIGTGVLAVPHAFSTGGVVPCALALLALLAWNDWAGRRLIQARDLLDADALRRFNTGGGESPLAALTREVCGAAVAGVVEAVFFVLMFGVAVAYLVALHDFVRATPLALPLGVDVALAAAAAVPLALVDDFGSLAAAGAAALVALACSLAAIALYGVMRRERLGWAQSGTFVRRGVPEIFVDSSLDTSITRRHAIAASSRCLIRAGLDEARLRRRRGGRGRSDGVLLWSGPRGAASGGVDGRSRALRGRAARRAVHGVRGLCYCRCWCC